MESGFPFIAVSDADEVIGMSEVDLGKDSSLAGTVEEIGNER